MTQIYIYNDKNTQIQVGRMLQNCKLYNYCKIHRTGQCSAKCKLHPEHRHYYGLLVCDKVPSAKVQCTAGRGSGCVFTRALARFRAAPSRRDL